MSELAGYKYPLPCFWCFPPYDSSVIRSSNAECVLKYPQQPAVIPSPVSVPWWLPPWTEMPTLLVINVIQGEPSHEYAFILLACTVSPAQTHDRVELSERCHVAWSVIEKAGRCWYWLAWNFACLKPNRSREDKEKAKYYHWAGPKKTGYTYENTFKKHNGRQNLHRFATFKKKKRAFSSVSRT